MRRWVEIEREGRMIGTFVTDQPPAARSDLSLPYVISDSMPAIEHVDGRFYDSKSAFRAVSRAEGLIEVGNEKLKPMTRGSSSPAFKQKRRAMIRDALEKVRAGHYERYFYPDGTSRARERAAATDRGDDT